MNLFTRAWQGAALSPAERATLRFVEHLVMSAFLTAFVAVLPLLSGATTPDWQRVGVVGGATLVMTALATMQKWFTAHNDPLPASAASLASSEIQQATGVTPPPAVQPPTWLDPTPALPTFNIPTPPPTV